MATPAQTPTAQPTPPPQQGLQHPLVDVAAVLAAAGAVGAGIDVAGKAVVAPPAAMAITAAGVAKVTASTLRSLSVFSQHRLAVRTKELKQFLADNYPDRPPKQLAQAVVDEGKYERAFAKKMRARLERDLPTSLQVADPDKRRAAVLKLLEREERYLRMREEAMNDRAIASLERASVRGQSPKGAYWKLSPDVMQHTPDCIAMGEKFWPWSVLAMIHPPTHAGCRCQLYTLDEAVTRDWMSPEHADVVDYDALARAKELLKEARVVAEIFTLGEFRGRLVELEEAGADLDGAMVAFYPDPATAKKLAVPGGEAAAQLHVTLKFLASDAGDLSAKLKADIADALAVFSAKEEPLVGRTDGVDKFASKSGDDGAEEYPVFAKIDVAGIQWFRKRLVAALPKGVMEDTYPSYVPHMTLKYVPKGKPADLSAPRVPLRFDRVVLVIGGSKQSFVLGEPLQEAFLPYFHPRDRRGRWRWSGRQQRPSPNTVGELQAQWAQLDRALLPYAGKPNAPEARAIISEQKKVTRRIHHANIDRGGAGGIGLPGGPRDVVVVGSGPAGLSAAIYGATEGLDTLMVDANPGPGGQAGLSSRIENVLGFPAGVTGRQYATMGLEQAQRTGAETQFSTRVTGLDYDPKTGLKRLRLANGKSIAARAVVIAGGVQFMQVSVPGAPEGSLIYGDSTRLKKTCAGRPVVIVGGANSAGQAAVDVAAVASHVTIMIRHGKLSDKMSSYLVSQLESDPKVTIMTGEIASAQAVGPSMEAVTLKDGQVIPAAAVGLFIGSAPKADWAGVDRDEHGYITVGHGGALETSIPGVYAAGDVRAGSVHRVITAAADGAAAIAQTHGFMETLRRAEPVQEALDEVTHDVADAWMDSMDALDQHGPFTGFTGFLGNQGFNGNKEINEALSAREQTSLDAESARIKASAKTPAGQRRHKFVAAHWTHPNGHPRCKICGDEERTGGICNGEPTAAEAQAWADRENKSGMWGKSKWLVKAGKLTMDLGESRFDQPHKCKYGDHAATKALIHAEGAAYVPVCGKHEARARRTLGAHEVVKVVRLPTELQEAQLRYPKGTVEGGEFMPRTGRLGHPSSRARRALLRELVPGLPRTPRQRMGVRRSASLDGRIVSVPEHRSFKRTIGGHVFTSPAGSTRIYRDGRPYEGPKGKHEVAPALELPRLLRPPEPTSLEDTDHEAALRVIARALERKQPDVPPAVAGAAGWPTDEALRDAGFMETGFRDTHGGLMFSYVAPDGASTLDVTYSKDGAKVGSVGWAPHEPVAPGVQLDRPARTWDEFCADMSSYARQTALDHGRHALLGEIHVNPDFLDHSGEHYWDGHVDLAPEIQSDMIAAAVARARTGSLTDTQKRRVYAANQSSIHEMLHAANAVSRSDYDGVGMVLEEGLTEELSRIEAVKHLRRQGQDDVVQWAADHPTDPKVLGTYPAYRHAIDELLNEAKVAPELREKMIERLKFADPADRVPTLAAAVAAGQDITPDEAEARVVDTLRNVGKPTTGWSPATDWDTVPILTANVDPSPSVPPHEIGGSPVQVGDTVSVNRRTWFEPLEGVPGEWRTSRANGRVSKVTDSEDGWMMDVDYGGGETDYNVFPRQVITVEAPDADRVSFGTAAAVLTVGSVTVRPGDMVRYDGRADGGFSEARVVRVIRDSNPNGEPENQDWVLEALTSAHSLTPGQRVLLTPGRTGSQIELAGSESDASAGSGAKRAVESFTLERKARLGRHFALAPGVQAVALPRVVAGEQPRPSRLRQEVARLSDPLAGTRPAPVGFERADGRVMVEDGALVHAADLAGLTHLPVRVDRRWRERAMRVLARDRTVFERANREHGDAHTAAKVRATREALAIIDAGGGQDEILDRALTHGPLHGGGEDNEGFQEGMRNAWLELDRAREVAGKAQSGKRQVLSPHGPAPHGHVAEPSPAAGGPGGSGSSVRFAETTDAARFNRALTGSKRPGFLTHHTDAELGHNRLYLTPDATAGYALDPAGDLQNVFRNPGGVKGAGRVAVREAVQHGARTLDAFDGFLPDLYQKEGFRVVGRMAWNDEFAPDGWKAEYGKPDVVFMATNPSDTTERRFDDWDEAKAYSRSVSRPLGVEQDYGDAYERAARAMVAAGGPSGARKGKWSWEKLWDEEPQQPLHAPASWQQQVYGSGGKGADGPPAKPVEPTPFEPTKMPGKDRALVRDVLGNEFVAQWSQAANMMFLDPVGGELAKKPTAIEDLPELLYLGKPAPAAYKPPEPKWDDAHTVVTTKPAGGSNGAMLAKAEDGTEWLTKTYRGDVDRVATELLANAVYRKLGVRVPEAGELMFDGKPAIGYPLLEGKPERWKGANAELAEGFMADALLANWDVVGLDQDNVLWDPDGHPFRVDQGGTLQYRAQGQTKPFGPVPSEVWSMNSPNGGQAFGRMAITGSTKKQGAAKIAKVLKPAVIDELVDAAPFENEKMRAEVRDALKARVAWMGDYAKGKVDEPRPPEGAEAAKVLAAAQAGLSLLPEQQVAVDAFLTGWEAPLNVWLRGGSKKADGSKELSFLSRELDGLARHTAAPADLVAYAVVRLPPGKDPDGLELRDRGFMPLSLEVPEASVPEERVAKVLVPKGTPLLYLHGVSPVPVLTLGKDRSLRLLPGDGDVVNAVVKSAGW